MKLNLFAAWSGYTLALVAIATLAMTLFAAGSGNSGYALLGGLAVVAAVAIAVGMVVTTIHRDHKRHMDTPHLF
ncbi:hypothetical protein [Rhodococcus chondri]|uniref:UsfY protein n=1 Tax=Rhodococcus chondri TaxID=3065941 RepID=A0ABU7JRX7_9NOCA|nr:hypothetical protein [Rhodococcus sp. CC-R104]MEE2032067.1 hypothetical protein [Rhodococcus sp. CC-R104]